MNEITAAYELAMTLKALKTANLAPVTGTIQSVQGNLVTLSANPGATANQFQGGVLRVTSGTLDGVSATILTHTPTAYQITTNFATTMRPAQGDTVEISAGPLGSADVFMFEPTTVQPQNVAGSVHAFAVTVNIYGESFHSETFGNKIKRWLGFERAMDIEVVVEGPYATGSSSNLDTVRAALFDLHALKEQVIWGCVDFAYDDRRQVRLKSDIETTYLQMQRTGSEYRHAAVIEFTIGVRG